MHVGATSGAGTLSTPPRRFALAADRLRHLAGAAGPFPATELSDALSDVVEASASIAIGHPSVRPSFVMGPLWRR
jgi:hypothetical protein